MARTRPGQQQQPASASVTTSQQPPAQLSDVTSSHWDMSTSSRRSLAPQETISLSPGDPLRDLFEACKHGDVSRVRTLVTPHNVNARDTAGRKSSPLHFAAGSNTNTRSWIAQQHSTAPPPRDNDWLLATSDDTIHTDMQTAIGCTHWQIYTAYNDQN